MTAISNQLPYTPLNPPADPKGSYSVMAAVIQRVAFAVLITGFFATFGVALSISAGAESLMDAAIIGGIIGFIGSLPLLILGTLPTAIEGYRMQCLELMESGISNPRALAALRNLRGFFQYPLNRFSHHYQYALLHNEIAAVTEKIDPERSDVMKTWAGLLKHLHDLPVKFPGGGQVKLDLSLEFEKMQGRGREVASEWLTTKRAGPDRDSLEEIQAILRESVGRKERFSAKQMAQAVASSPNCHIVVSRDVATHEIVGYGWYFQIENAIEIASLARRAPYARLGIGSELLAQMLQRFDRKKEVQLHVRKSNASAMRLYQKWGFEQVEVQTDYYRSDPIEDGVLMKLNWEKYTSLTD